MRAPGGALTDGRVLVTGANGFVGSAVVDALARAGAAIAPGTVLAGAVPRIIDEWQIEPAIWNHIRRAIVDRAQPGQFILTATRLASICATIAIVARRSPRPPPRRAQIVADRPVPSHSNLARRVHGAFDRHRGETTCGLGPRRPMDWPTWSGFLFLAIVLDVFSRRIVGWAIGTSLKTDLVLDALQMATAQRRPHGGKHCRELGVVPSHGSVGDCYENAMAESCFATLECELIDRRRWHSLADARPALFLYIEGWYNLPRCHKALGQRSPINYERAMGGQSMAA